MRLEKVIVYILLWLLKIWYVTQTDCYTLSPPPRKQRCTVYHGNSNLHNAADVNNPKSYRIYVGIYVCYGVCVSLCNRLFTQMTASGAVWRARRLACRTMGVHKQVISEILQTGTHQLACSWMITRLFPLTVTSHFIWFTRGAAHCVCGNGIMGATGVHPVRVSYCFID